MILAWEKCFPEPTAGLKGPEGQVEMATLGCFGVFLGEKLQGSLILPGFFFSEDTIHIGNENEDFRPPDLLGGGASRGPTHRRPALMLCVSPSLLRSECWGVLCLVHSAESHGDLALPGKGVPYACRARTERGS